MVLGLLPDFSVRAKGFCGGRIMAVIIFEIILVKG
jgi:hypothetical protein